MIIVIIMIWWQGRKRCESNIRPGTARLKYTAVVFVALFDSWPGLFFFTNDFSRSVLAVKIIYKQKKLRLLNNLVLCHCRSTVITAGFLLRLLRALLFIVKHSSLPTNSRFWLQWYKIWYLDVCHFAYFIDFSVKFLFFNVCVFFFFFLFVYWDRLFKF